MLASGAATAYATHTARSYHHRNYEATHPDSHLDDTFRDDLLKDKTDKALDQVLERAIFREANVGIKEQSPGRRRP